MLCRDFLGEKGKTSSPGVFEESTWGFDRPMTLDEGIYHVEKCAMSVSQSRASHHRIPVLQGMVSRRIELRCQYPSTHFL